MSLEKGPSNKKLESTMVTCPHCHGDKKSRLKKDAPCESCHGTGKVADKHR